ncbi:MAG: response regulator transcription factor [Coriobacteriia bacterium]|nr:response regulator transcription factor [Coriobacteriia bacterium]MBN2821955.1 response regulator transcription factor [Coriobacteriia bacterium]
MASTSVYIIDDHQLVRYGLRAVIEADGDMVVIGEAASGEEAIEWLHDLRPDIVLLDLRMPGIGGVETCRRLLDRDPKMRVVVLTSYDDDDEVFGVLSAGAVGYLMKDASAESLLQSLRGVADGQTVLDSAVARRVIDAKGMSPEASDAPLLSNREMDVLALMARGCNNRSIAQELWISEPTVKSHVSHILRKLDSRDRTQAVVEAIRLRLVDMPLEESD